MALDLQKQFAQASSGEGSGASSDESEVLSPLKQNPQAPPGWSKVRLTGPLGKGKGKGGKGGRTREAAARAPLAGEAQYNQPAESIKPFAQRPPRVPQQSLQKVISTQTAGQQGAARVANQRAVCKVQRNAERIRALAGTGGAAQGAGSGPEPWLLSALQHASQV
jgi:hypothetical protein